jgi:hypothetical protein
MGLTLIEAATGCVEPAETRLEHLAVIKTFAEGELLSRLPLRRAAAEPVQELVVAPPHPLEAALGRLPQGRSAPRAGAIPTGRALRARASASGVRAPSAPIQAARSAGFRVGGTVSGHWAATLGPS